MLIISSDRKPYINMQKTEKCSSAFTYFCQFLFFFCDMDAIFLHVFGIFSAICNYFVNALFSVIFLQSKCATLVKNGTGSFPLNSRIISKSQHYQWWLFVHVNGLSNCLLPEKCTIFDDLVNNAVSPPFSEYAWHEIMLERTRNFLWRMKVP